MDDVEGRIEIVYCIDDLAEYMSRLGFGEFGLCFDAFEEIVGGTTNH